MKTIITGLLLLLSSSTFAQELAAPENPLQPFEFLIGGAWVTQTTYQTFEWGLNKQAVYSELFFVEGDSLVKSGEMTWFWHPGEKKIKGYAHSTNMAMNFFEYETTFENPREMRNIFYAWGGNFDGIPQYETLIFIDENEYKWTSYDRVGDKLEPGLSITFRRELK